MENRKNGPWKILVISDSEQDYRMVQELLGEGGDDRFDLHWVAASGKAYHDVCFGDYDVILVEHPPELLPGIDLIEAADKLCPGESILLLYSLEEAGEGEKAIDHGASGYLTKEKLTPSILKLNLMSAIEKKTEQTVAQREVT